MNKEWDLSPLYEGIHTQRFQQDLKTLRQTVADYNAFAAALPEDRAAGIRGALELQEKLYALAGPMFEYCSLRSAVNTSDGEALDSMSALQKLLSEAEYMSDIIELMRSTYPNTIKKGRSSIWASIILSEKQLLIAIQQINNTNRKI